MPSPSLRSPRPFMMPRKILVSSSTSSSSSAARANVPAQPISTAMPTVAVSAILRNLRFDLKLVMPTPNPLNSRQFAAFDPVNLGSGRFWGVVTPYGFIQEAGDPGNDGYIGEVKDVPIKAPSSGFDVQQHKIGHRTVDQAVDAIAERPADDQPQRNGRQP